MGIYESLTRNQGNIDQIAGVVQGYFDRKRDKERIQRVRDRLSSSQEKPPTDIPSMDATQIPDQPGMGMPDVPPGQGAIDERLRRTTGRQVERPNAAPDLGRAITSEPRPVQQPVPMETRYNGIQRPEDIYAIAEDMKWSPEQALEKSEAFRQSQKPRAVFASPGSQPGTIDANGNFNPSGPRIGRDDMTHTDYEDFRKDYPNTPQGAKKAAEDWVALHVRPDKPDKPDLTGPRQEKKAIEDLINDYAKNDELVKNLESSYGGSEGIKKLQESSVRAVDVAKLSDPNVLKDEVLRGLFNETLSGQKQVGMDHTKAVAARQAAARALASRGLDTDGRPIKKGATAPPATGEPPKLTGRKFKVKILSDIPGANGTIKAGSTGMIDEAEFNPQTMEKAQ